MGKNYYLNKDSQTGEILYLEYNKIKGYPITPKTKIEDAIEVNKIIFVNPSLREKLIRKKVDLKIRYLIKILQTMDETGSDEGQIQRSIMDSERLKVNILNYYIKYLGTTYASYSIKKINLIINQLRIRLYNINLQKKILSSYYNKDLYYLDEEETKKGRGR